MFQWRRFQFFDKDLVKDEGSNQPNSELQKMDLAACASGRGMVLLGDSEGAVHVVDKYFKINHFQAYESRVSHMHQMKQNNLLLTIGDDLAESGVLKIWNMDKPESGGTVVRVIKLFNKEFPECPITAMWVKDDMSIVTLGLLNGIVIVLRGDLLRDNKFTRTRLQPCEDAITSMGLYDKDQVFVVVSRTAVKSFHNFRQDSMEVMDELGSATGCAVFGEDAPRQMVVGRKEAVYFYEKEGRGPCLAFDGDKKMLYSMRSYLLVVSHDAEDSTAPENLSIYDLANKFVAFNGMFNGIKNVVAEWGTVLVHQTDGKVYQLTEKDTQTKLEMLFRRNLYTIAISLAHSQNFDMAYIIDIYRKFADHLYSKGDYDGSMLQYLRTIGRLEPSYVIRKFLDAQRIHNLTSYLQELHEKGLANADHTTLLLNCYTKLRDVKKLDEFIKAPTDTVTFEVETAIKVCKQAGYHDHALYLAEKFKAHDWFVKILLEEQGNHDKALDYIAKLDFYQAEKNLKKYGKTLVGSEPDRTTEMLMELCSSGDNARPKLLAPRQKNLSARPEEFMGLFVESPKMLMAFLEYIVSSEGHRATNLVYNTLIELYLRGGEDDVDDAAAALRARTEKAMSLLQNGASKYDSDHVLVLCQLHDFKPGTLFLYEKLKLFGEIAQHYMDHAEYGNILRACKKYGDKDPNLWVQALTYFAKRDDNCQSEIIEVLNYIEKDQLLPPLMVVQILASNSSATLAVLRDYIVRRLTAENTIVVEDRRLIKHYREETEKMRSEIEEINTSAKIFQLSKCVGCAAPLDLPAVHFLCMHSFHQRCLGDNEKECPSCESDNKKVLEMRRSLEQNQGGHDQFFKQLEGAGDGFTVVSEYFGRGIFSKPSANSQPRM